jgi:hypothetical protein
MPSAELERLADRDLLARELLDGVRELPLPGGPP